MDQVADLKNRFLTSGGSEAAFEEIGRGKLGLVDGQPQDGCLRPGDAREQALRSFVPGALIEIQCYNSRGRSQGEEILVFEKWISKTDLTFRASHLVASNDYYEWWASHEANYNRTIFHVCQVARNRCGFRGPGGEDVIHITRWKMVSPQGLLGGGYASRKALEHFEKQLTEYLDHQAMVVSEGSPAVVAAGPKAAAPVAATSGLDAAFMGGAGAPGDDDAEVDHLLKLAAEAKKGPAPPAEKPGKAPKGKGLSQLLAEKAQLLESERKSRGRSGPSGGLRLDADPEVGHRRKKRRRDRSESPDGSSGSEKDFRVASSWEVDLLALSQRDPGCLLRSALREMKRYLAARGEANKEDLTAGRVVSYLHQILLPQYPKAGLRSQRELVTLATGLDMLLEGDLGRLGDLLVQRFKAIEASLSADGNWSVARHQELIPIQASLSTRAELTEAAKAELRALKLKQQLHKGGKVG